MSDIVIQKLEYPNNVRFKASMYLGDTTTPTTAIREIIDNSLDEAMNGFADKVIINIDDNTFWNSSLDNGRGIPIYKDADKEGDEEITTDIFSKLHSGGKFEANLVSIGTFGIGSAATNAVSDDFIAVINIPNNTNTREKPEWIKEGIAKGDDTYLLHFKRGLFHNKFTSKYQEVKDYLLELGIKEYQIPNDFSSWSSFVLCKPDSTIFSSLKSKYKERELQLQKMLNPNIDLQFNGKQVEIFDITKDSFKQTQFFNDKVFSLTVDYEAPYEYHGQSRTSKNRFIVAFGYSQNDFSTVTDGSVNTLDTPDGYHVNLASRLLQKSFKDIFPDMEAKDAIYGLRLFCLVMTNASEYTSQDKVRLGRIYGINEADLQSLFKRELIKIVNENKEYFESLCLRINEYKATIGTLSQKNFVKSVVIYGDDKRAKGLGAQVFDCSSKNREECELFIAEGKSAGGSIIAARDSKFHAVLPLRGKLFNSSNAELEEALNNKEIRSMINCIGVGISPYVDLSKRRYGKVIIACDADCDGLHIQVLVLGAFAKFLPELIEAGMLYLGLAPIYEQKINGQTNYYWLDKMDGFQHNKSFLRYKGLGSCPPKTLRDTLINKDQRRLIQITPENINEAVNLLQDAYLRRELMVENGVVDFNAMQSVSEEDVDDLLKYSPQSLSVEEYEIANQNL